MVAWAGKIANGGPYKSVRDVYNNAKLSGAEKAMFKKYESSFVALDKKLLLDPMRGRDPYRSPFNKD